MQTNLSVQTVQTNCGGEVGGGICKSRGEVGGGICKSVITYTFANPPSHLSPTVGLHSLHGDVGLHLIRCPSVNYVSWDCKKRAYNEENVLYERISLEG